MAVTIHQSPPTYSISGNPLVFVFSSDQTAQANFTYKIEVTINGTLRETHQILPEAGIRAHFDASDVAERYCSVPIESNDSQVYSAGTDILLKVDVIESYGTPPTDQLNTATTITTIKGRQRKADFIAYDPTDYVINTNKLWLTTFPRTEKRYINLAKVNKYQFITDGSTLQNRVRLYDSSDVLIQTKDSPSVVQPKVTISNINNTTLVSDWGFLTSEIAQASYLEIAWRIGGSNFSEWLRLYIDDRCYSTSAQHLLFMSPLGSLEPYTFIKRSTEKVKIKGEGYESQFGQFDAGGTWVYGLGGVTDFVKQLEESIEVQTDWLSEDEYTWLTKTMLASPLVYLQNGSDLIKVRVEAKSYTTKTSENDMVFNLKVDILTGYDQSSFV